jgi:GYF domain 2
MSTSEANAPAEPPLPTNPGGWHFVQRSGKGDRAVGPVDTDHLLKLARAGELSHASLVWREGMADWSPIAQTPELATRMPAPPTNPGASFTQLRGGPAHPLGDDAGMRLLLPVGRSGWAIASGYLGLFSVLILPAPLALLTGIVAIWDIRTHEHRHGMGRAIFGIAAGTAGTIAMLAFGVISIL